MKRANVLTSLLIATAILSVFCFFPFPFHVNGSVETQPKDGREVHAIVPGKLVRWYKKPGDRVQAGEAICDLENIQLQLQLQEAITKRDLAKQRLDQIRYVASSNPALALTAAEEEKALMTAEGTVQELGYKLQRLRVVSPIDGILFQPPEKSINKQSQAQEQLPSWHGNPFQASNSEAVFSEGDLLCFVAPTNEMEGVLVIDQHDRNLVKVGDQVELMFDAAKLQSYYGKIASFAQSEMKETSASLSTQTGGSLDTKTDESGRTLPMSTSYQAKVYFDGENLPIRGGYRGKANVHLAWKSLGWRLYRYAVKTFNFEF